MRAPSFFLSSLLMRRVALSIPRMGHRTFGLILFLALGALGVAGCGTTPAPKTPKSEPERPTLSTAELESARRRVFSLEHGDPRRDELRDAILYTLSKRTGELLESGDPETIDAHLRMMTELFSPEELDAPRLPEELRPISEGLLAGASKRGDEGRALAAAFLLERTTDEPETYRALIQTIHDWSREAREGLSSELERLSQLIQIAEEELGLVPARSIADRLAALILARRDALIRELSGSRGSFSPFPARMVGLAPLELAAVDLRSGDVEKAIDRLVAMNDTIPTTAQFIDVLKRARGDDPAAGDALIELAEFYRSARPEVSLGICRRGLLRLPHDARFPVCLARIAADRENYLEATAFYADAISTNENERAIYDEALSQLSTFIERGIFEPNPKTARSLVAHAERIFESRRIHFPDAPPSVPEERFEFLVGTLEMNAGEPEEALRRFKRSVEINPSAQSYTQLGSLALRMGKLDESARAFEEALALTPATTMASLPVRAEILRAYAELFATKGEREREQAILSEALSLWERAEPAFLGDRAGLVALNRGLLLQKLGQRDEARAAFDRAFTLSPKQQTIYASILSALTADQRPDTELAETTLRRALQHLSLDPEWKAYFALWTRLIALREGADEPALVTHLLEGLAEGRAWPARLARFALGRMEGAELVDAAENKGELAEAHFYIAVDALQKKDAGGGGEAYRRALEAVIETEMVAFYEYEMASALLRELDRAQENGSP